jgi:hypothetical protein
LRKNSFPKPEILKEKPSCDVIAQAMFEKTKKTSPSGFCRKPTKTAEPMNTWLLLWLVS